jgi:hypothetical protein
MRRSWFLVSLVVLVGLLVGVAAARRSADDATLTAGSAERPGFDDEGLVTDDGEEAVEPLELRIVAPEFALIDEEVSLSVETIDDAEELPDEIDLDWTVDGEAVNGSTHIFSEAGTHEVAVSAADDAYVVEPVEIRVFPIPDLQIAGTENPDLGEARHSTGAALQFDAQIRPSGAFDGIEWTYDWRLPDGWLAGDSGGTGRKVDVIASDEGEFTVRVSIAPADERLAELDGLSITARATLIIDPTVEPRCPAGTTGTPPNCVTEPEPRCPAGTTGTPPNCVTTTGPTQPPVNNAPVANLATNTVSTTSVWTKLCVLQNASDPDGDPLTLTAVTSPTPVGISSIDGAVSGQPNCAQTVRYEWPSGWSGVASMTFTVSDGRGGTDTAEARITVTAS